MEKAAFMVRGAGGMEGGERVSDATAKDTELSQTLAL